MPPELGDRLAAVSRDLAAAAAAIWHLAHRVTDLLDARLALGLSPVGREALAASLLLAAAALVLWVAHGLWSVLRRFALGGLDPTQLQHWQETGQLAAVARFYTERGSHRRAARWYRAAGQTALAVEAFVAAGDLDRAAAVAEGAALWPKAARIRLAQGRPEAAAAAFVEAGEAGEAAEAWVAAGRPDRAAEALVAAVAPGGTRREEAARLAATLLVGGAAPAPPGLAAGAARVLEEAGEPDSAARLWIVAGDAVAAARCRLAAGDPGAAAELFAAAGQVREAHAARGDELRGVGDATGAAEAYGRAERHEEAAACWEEAADPARAAAAWERAGRWGRAGAQLFEAGRLDAAVPVLQKVAPEDPEWLSARLLLGKCFYLLDEPHAAAAVLDEVLRDGAPGAADREALYLLGSAREAAGELRSALAAFARLHGLDAGYRDVARRMAALHDRIDLEMARSPEPPHPSPPAPLPATLTGPHGLLGGRYRIEREVGRGAMAVVFLAWDARLERRVALKSLGPTADRERFLREARLAAKVDHPNVVKIFDAVVEGDDAFLVLQPVSGESLGRRISREGALPPGLVRRVGAEIAGALAAVHGEGLVHRDVKPENVLLDSTGRAHLADFGLALGTDEPRVTAPDVVKGTLAFLAPELLAGAPPSPAADVFALGLVLYEALTGAAVYEGPAALEEKLRGGPPPLGAARPDLDVDLATVVDRCLAQDPSDRPAAEAVARELASGADEPNG